MCLKVSATDTDIITLSMVSVAFYCLRHCSAELIGVSERRALHRFRPSVGYASEERRFRCNVTVRTWIIISLMVVLFASMVHRSNSNEAGGRVFEICWRCTLS